MKESSLKQKLRAMVENDNISTEDVIAFRDKHIKTVGNCNVLMCMKSYRMIHAILRDTIDCVKKSLA